MEKEFKNVMPSIRYKISRKELHKFSCRIQARVDLCGDIERVSEGLYFNRQIPCERIKLFLLVTFIEMLISKNS